MREIPVPGVHRFEFTAVDGDHCGREQARAPAHYDEFATDFADGRAVVLAEIGDGLEVRRQAARQPHDFDVALAFPLKPAAGLNAVEVSIDVELQHHRGIVSGPSRELRLNAPEAKLAKIELIDEKIDHPHRIILGDIVFQLSRKHRSLSAIRPDYKAGHAISLLLEEKILRQNQFSEKLDFSHSLGPRQPIKKVDMEKGKACFE